MTFFENIVSKALRVEGQRCGPHLRGRTHTCSERATSSSGVSQRWETEFCQESLPALCAPPAPRPSSWWAQLLAAAATCLGLANRWPWVSGTVPISNVLSGCQTNVLLFSSGIMEYLIHGYKSCQLLQVLSQKGVASRKAGWSFSKAG